MSEWLRIDGKVEREVLIEGIVLSKICRRCRNLLRRRPWSGYPNGSVPKVRRVWRQFSPGGVFHMFDRTDGRQGCKGRVEASDG
jgi:hypothetical protein